MNFGIALKINKLPKIGRMELNYFPLGNTEDNKLVKIFRIFFGIVCIGIAFFWLYFNYTSLKTNWTLWITIIFLLVFGLYQIWSGSGRATRFIIISSGNIRLKKDAIRPAFQIMPAEIERIEFFPLSVVFFLRSEKKILLRFGTINYETNEKIVDELMVFAEANEIPFEIKEEII